jgi:peptide/nickel transport system ATP-binding protein
MLRCPLRPCLKPEDKLVLAAVERAHPAIVLGPKAAPFGFQRTIYQFTDESRRTRRRRGEPPSAVQFLPGAAFHTRCLAALPQCWTVQPVLMSSGDGRTVACHNPF